MKPLLFEEGLHLVRNGIERFPWNPATAKMLTKHHYFTRRLLHDLERGEEVYQSNADYRLEKSNGKKLDDILTCPNCGYLYRQEKTGRKP